MDEHQSPNIPGLITSSLLTLGPWEYRLPGLAAEEGEYIEVTHVLYVHYSISPTVTG